MSNDNPTDNNSGDGAILSGPDPAPKKRKWGGGPDTHKPGCKCNACVARRRKAKAIDGSTGRELLLSDLTKNKTPKAGLEEIISADLPPIVMRGRTPRDRVLEWLEIRAMNPNITNKDAAEKMGIAISHLNTIITRARKAGWLIFEDPMQRIEHEIMPKVAENLNYYLDQRDRTVTIETAKGTLFKQFEKAHGIGEQTSQTVLAIKIEYPETLPEGPEIKILSRGNVVGTPKAGPGPE